MNKLLIRKIVISGVFSALALISFIIESLLPSIFIVGARIGISNIFILLTIIIVGYQYSFAVLVIKVLLGSIFCGNISAIIYSLPAGIVSIIIEIMLLRFYKKFSIISISVCGAVVNSLIQNVIFCLATSTWSYLLYLPYLTLIATFAGLIIGLLTFLIIRYLPLSIFNKLIEN